MSGHRDNNPSAQLRNRFRLQFQQDLREYMARNGSAAEGFGVVWERILEQVPIQEPEQAEMYWELIQWASSYDLFTSAEQRQFLAGWAENDSLRKHPG